MAEAPRAFSAPIKARKGESKPALEYGKKHDLAKTLNTVPKLERNVARARAESK